MVSEGKNTTNTELIWKAVTKGKRTRKSMARSINSSAKLGNFSSPNGVGIFSGSDPDRSGESVARESVYGKSNSVPLKKRKHLHESRSPHTRTHLGFLKQETKDTGDFSGIELLAAAASMENIDDDNNRYLIVENSSSLNNSDASKSAAQRKIDLKNDDPESSSNIMTVNAGNSDHFQALTNSTTVSQSPCGKPVDVIIPQLNRHHWDLNTLMDAWVLPCDDSVVGNNSNDMHIDVVKDLSNATVGMFSGQDTMKDAGEESPDQVLGGGVQKDSSYNVTNTDTVVGCSPSSEITHEEKINTTSMTVVMNKSKHSSSNISKADRISGSVNQMVTQATLDKPACQISKTAVNEQCKGMKDQWKDCEPPGSVIQDGRPVLSADSRIQKNGAYIPCLMADSRGQSAELVIDKGGSELPNEGYRSNDLEDSYKSSVVGAQCGDPTSSAGKTGSLVDGQRNYDVSQDHNFRMVDKDGLTKYQNECKSPYEDGELRGTVLYSWEDNELEDEYVDYESDGRNGEGSEATDYQPENFEGDSGEYLGNQMDDSKEIPERSKVGSVKQHSSSFFVKDDSINSEASGMGSIEVSGTMVTELLEMNKKNDFRKGRHLADMRDARMIQMDKYKPEIVRRKLQFQNEGWSLFDATDAKDAYMQQYRSRRFSSSHSHPERAITYTGEHLARYRPSTRGEKVGVQHPASWNSRRQHPSKVHRAEGRSSFRPKNMLRNLDKMYGNDFEDPGQAADYFSNQMRGRIMRSPEGVGYFDVRSNGIPVKRGRGNYRSRGPYRCLGGRDVVEHFEPVADEYNFPVRYLSTQECSFSPNSGRSAHISLPCKRPHSKSRTHSPGPWHPYKEQKILCTRRHSKSPDFRSEARTVRRTRAPFLKPTFISNSGEGYISSTRGCLSSVQRNCRWVDDGGFETNHSMPNISPVREVRRTKKFEGYPGQLKSDDCFRPMFHSQRFPFISSGGREYKLESNYDGRRYENGNKMMYRGSQPAGW